MLMKSTRYTEVNRRRLGDLGELRTGYQLRGAARPQEGGANRIIQLGDVRDEGIDIDRLVRVELSGADEGDFVGAGDILLRSRGASYRAALVPECPPGTVAVAPLYVLRLRAPGVLPAFVVWYVNQQGVQATLAGHARGTHIPTVSRQAFAELEIVLPPLAEQQRVAAIDALVREERILTLHLLEKQEQRVQALLESALQRWES
jgi:hypothetical protein